MLKTLLMGTVALSPLVANAAAVVPNKADSGWLMVASLLVILMCLPGLALFYGGLVRRKNMLSVLMQSLSVFALITVLWVIFGYSLAFTEGSSWIGGFSRVFLSGIGPDSTAATFSRGVVIPELLFVVFQGAFAAITCALIVGAVAERVRFSALLLFVVLWFCLAYLPVAHMVWFWAGADSYTSAEAAAAADASAGLLFRLGALDFAGGTVVHLNAAAAALVAAWTVGKRIGYGRESMAPHNLTFTLVGAALLWVGWFGFNAGSALEANGVAALAFVNTWVAPACAALSWIAVEWLLKGKPSLLGACSGAIAGLVAITPACGFVGVGGALAIGLIAGPACYWGVNGLKRWLKVDDSLDVFGIHGVGAIVGALLTAVFAAPGLGGSGIWDYLANQSAASYDIAHQLWVQTQALVLTLVWSAIAAWIALKLADLIIGLRVEEDAEREGLDVTSHGEQAYHG